MSFFSFITIVNLTLLFVLLIEVIVSYIKNDGVYLPKEAANNLISGIVLNAVTKFFNDYYVDFSNEYLLSFIKITEVNIYSALLCLLLVDFFYYIFHYMHHRIDFLWTFHKVHHSDRNFNITTSYRISWIEHVYFLLFFTPILLIGFKPVTILSALYYLAIHQMFCHSSYIKFPRICELIFVTPTSHALHHDMKRENHDSNYGGIFSIWDHLFSTYKVTTKKINFGIEDFKSDFVLSFQFTPVITKIKELKWSTFFN